MTPADAALDRASSIRAAVTAYDAALRNTGDEAIVWREADKVAIWDEAAHQDATQRFRDSVDRLADAMYALHRANNEPMSRKVTQKFGPEFGGMFDREIGGLVENERDVIRAEDLAPLPLLDNRAAEVARRGGAL